MIPVNRLLGAGWDGAFSSAPDGRNFDDRPAVARLADCAAVADLDHFGLLDRGRQTVSQIRGDLVAADRDGVGEYDLRPSMNTAAPVDAGAHIDHRCAQRPFILDERRQAGRIGRHDEVIDLQMAARGRTPPDCATGPASAVMVWTSAPSVSPNRPFGFLMPRVASSRKPTGMVWIRARSSSFSTRCPRCRTRRMSAGPTSPFEMGASNDTISDCGCPQLTETITDFTVSPVMFSAMCTVLAIESRAASMSTTEPRAHSFHVAFADADRAQLAGRQALRDDAGDLAGSDIQRSDQLVSGSGRGAVSFGHRATGLLSPVAIAVGGASRRAGRLFGFAVRRADDEFETGPHVEAQRASGEQIVRAVQVGEPVPGGVGPVFRQFQENAVIESEIPPAAPPAGSPERRVWPAPAASVAALSGRRSVPAHRRP